MASLSLYNIITSLFNFYSILVVLYCLLTWFPRGNGGIVDDLSAVLESIVGPYLGFFRRFIPPMMGIDFSPVVAILALNIIERLVYNLLTRI